MFLKSLDRIRKTLGFRLTIWYSFIFILSAVVLFILSYLLLSSSIQENREVIRAELRRYASIYQTGGVNSLEQQFGQPKRASLLSSYFVRVADPENKTVFLNSPHLWERFDLKRLEDKAVGGEWFYLSSNRDGDILEVSTVDLPDHYRLQVGKIKEDRKEILEHFRETFASVMILLIVIGFTGGAFLAFRALRPIRDLVQVTRSVVSTGKMDARVPMGQSGDELDELVRLFNKMLERIEDLISRMREALDNVAHDLRTPMTRLRGIAEMTLQSDSHLEGCREALADCLEESGRALTMLNTIMDISEAETGMMKLNLETVEISSLIEGVVELYGYVADDHGISISVNCADNLRLTADRNRMQQVLANLLDNAIKYTPNGGRVDIQAYQKLQQVVLTVIDTGVGIPPEDISKIWDRLYRGDKSRSQRGLGLGLSVVKAIVEAHGGHVEVSSKPGGGSLFTLYLPATSSQIR